MSKKLPVVVALIALLSGAALAQDAKAVLDSAAKAMGAADLKSIQYSGSGSNFSLGQSGNPNSAWPRFNVKNYTRTINYDSIASREEVVRMPAEYPVRSGGGPPPASEQRTAQLVSGSHAWNMAGNNAAPAPAALNERLVQIWITPHGFLKGAMANLATVRAQSAGAKKVVSFLGHGKYKVQGTINEQNLVEKVETWLDNPVLGDMAIETAYSDYKAFGGVQFPTQILQRQGGHAMLELTVSEVRPNAPADIQVPDNVRQAAAPVVRVETQKLADGVWYLTGGSHHSVAVEFNDHVVVIEGPLNEARSEAVIAEVKKSVPNKPIKYLVNTHHHFDHSGGIRAFAAEGATIITHQINRPYYEKAFAAPRTLNPDRMAREKKKASFLTVTDKRVLKDRTRTLELHLIQGNLHNEGILLAYLPKEKLLIEADVYSPGPPPATPNPFSVNLYDNIQRLKLSVDQIAPMHGKLVALAELEKAIGKGKN